MIPVTYYNNLSSQYVLQYLVDVKLADRRWMNSHFSPMAKKKEQYHALPQSAMIASIFLTALSYSAAVEVVPGFL